MAIFSTVAWAQRGGTVFLSSHLLHEVEIIADELLIIGRGKIVAQGSKDELVARHGVLVRALDDAEMERALNAAELTYRLAPEAGYEFSADWFSANIPVWRTLLDQVRPQRVLEIGSYEGRSTVFIIERCAAAAPLALTAIDTWQGGIEYDAAMMQAVEQRFDRNVALARSRAAHPVTLTKIKGESFRALAQLNAEGRAGSAVQSAVNRNALAEPPRAAATSIARRATPPLSTKNMGIARRIASLIRARPIR